MTYDSIQTIPDEITPADATAMGISYTVQRIVSNDGIPGPGMKTVTLTINWRGSPAGSATAQNTIQFTTSFTTVITR